jgi:hypothetical protein
MRWLSSRSRTERELNRILANQETIMSALDDLKTEAAKAVASMNAATAALSSPSDAADLAAVTTDLATAQTALAAAIAAKSS